MQEAFAAHLRHIARLHPAAEHGRAVLIINNALWHRGKEIDEAPAEHRHLEFYRLPSYSPQLNVIKRFRKLLRRGLPCWHPRGLAELHPDCVALLPSDPPPADTAQIERAWAVIRSRYCPATWARAWEDRIIELARPDRAG